MGNSRGGLLILGVRDDNDVAVELSPVELTEGEEARVRQIAAANIAPHLTFDVRVVACEADASRGYYLLIVPPSTLQPHAVRKDRDLRYPLRDGTTTRWLSEPEVADMYRGRFAMAVGLAARLDAILAEGLAAMDLTEEAFVAVALVPTGAGSMPIDLARVAALGAWAWNEIGPTAWFEGFFEASSPPAPGVAAHRVTLKTIHDTSTPPSWVYAELHDDGAGFACHRLMDARTSWREWDESEAWIVNEGLLFHLSRSLLLLGRHAGEKRRVGRRAHRSPRS